MNILAKQAFDKGLSCAECVLSVVAREHGIKQGLIPTSMDIRGSSNSHNHVCNAILGGVIALEKKYGRDNHYANTLLERFNTAYGTCSCRELLGCDLNTPTGKENYINNQLHMRCREYVGKTAEIVDSIIRSASPDK